MTPHDFDEILILIQDEIPVLTEPVTLNCSANFFLLLAFHNSFYKLQIWHPINTFLIPSLQQKIQ